MRTIHQRHLGWDREHEPVAEVAPGEELTLDLADAGDGQVTPAWRSTDLDGYDGSRANPLTGPVRVVGAQPGDVLRVTIRSIEGAGWGWTAAIPGFGLLRDHLPEPHLIHSTYDRDTVRFGDVAALPCRPFVGTIGLAPSAAGTHDVIPPRRVGGNLDCRDLVQGAVVRLPVEVGGALLSLGDAHAAQGDGEVCGTAVETAARVTIRIDLDRGPQLTAPHLEVPERGGDQRAATYHTTGVGPDLLGCTRDAVLAMIDLLAGRGWDAYDAYLFCSVAGHLRIREVVDAPNWLVSFELPRDAVG